MVEMKTLSLFNYRWNNSSWYLTYVPKKKQQTRVIHLSTELDSYARCLRKYLIVSETVFT